MLGKDQQIAHDYIKSGVNTFVTGSGGNGKTYVTQPHVTEHTLCVGPTGVAAQNMGGITAHRAFGLPVSYPTSKDFTTVKPKIKKVLNNIDKLWIDEIGPIRQDMFMLIDAKLKKARGNKKPFGGVQVIASGDFYQCEPIVGWREKTQFYKDYTSPFAFDAPCWDFTTVELTQPQRHPNVRHYELLNQIRVGDASALQEILDISKPYSLSEDTLHLCVYNADAEKVNDYWFSKINKHKRNYKGILTGNYSEKDCRAPLMLELKEGCDVMICANDQNGQYVNGDRGKVLCMNSNSVEVELRDGRLVEVLEQVWENKEKVFKNGALQDNILGTFKQIPIKLGWAISIDKSQGLTLDSAAIHTGKGVFGAGKFYVAISRVRNLENLQFLRKQNITAKDIIVRKEVAEFYKSIKKVEG